MHFAISIEGAGPGFIMHRAGDVSAKVGRGDIPPAEAEAESTAYRMAPSKKFPKGEFYIPAEWLIAAIVASCDIIKLPKRGASRSTSAKQWIAGGMWINPHQIGLGMQDAELYVTSAVVPPRTGARVMRARYRIQKWKADFHLCVSDVDPAFTETARMLANNMRDVLVLAGSKAGIGDNRPSSPKKPGPHGTFRVLQCDFVE